MFEMASAKRRLSSWDHLVVDGLRDPVVRAAFGVVVLVAAVVLFFVLRGPDRRSFTFGPSTRPAIGAVVVTALASPYGHVSPARAREAERIAAADATLAGLLRLGDGRRVGDVGPWLAVGNDRTGGAALAFRLERPIAVDSDLPYVAIPPDAPAHGTCITPYAPGWAHLRASRVTRLGVLVDLRRGRVVEISTNAGRGRVGPVAGKPYPTCNEDQAP